MSVITVSRETGSFGDETARLLAEKLQYTLMDRSALERTIDGEKFPDIPLEHFDEQSPSFWENFTSGKDVYLDRLRTSILESATAGHVVFLGRGAQFVLDGVPGTLRVHLIASHDVRVQRTSETLKCDKKTAEKFCRKSDHDRSGYSRFFFGGHWADPVSYELTICTDHLNLEETGEMIVQAYKAFGAGRDEGGKILRNRLMAQVVRNRILYVRRIPVDLLEVEADDGHITVRGTVTTRYSAKYCEEAARSVEGVTSVDAEVYFVNPVMTY
jgi:cytidylate kinase